MMTNTLYRLRCWLLADADGLRLHRAQPAHWTRET